MVQPAVVHYNRAVDLERRGHYQDAAAEYQEAIRLDPNDADTHVRLGLLLRELGRDEDANRAFEAALVLRGAPDPTKRPDPSAPPTSGTIKS